MSLPNGLAYNVIAKPIGPVCNLACGYCYYLDKKGMYAAEKDFRMPDAVLEEFIRQYIESNEVPEAVFAWQGGEPTLLGVDFFRNAFALQRKYAGGKTIVNAFQTNGIRIDDEWCSLFAEHSVLVGISIDGPEIFHDRHRKTPGGSGSFRRAMRGFECLRKHGVEFNTLTAVTRDSQDSGLRIYRFLKGIGSRYMQFIPIVEQVAPRTKVGKSSPPGNVMVSPRTVQPGAYGRFLIAIFDEWRRADMGEYSVQMLDMMLEKWLGMPPSLCLFAERCGSALAMEYNGDVYSCDHFVYPQNRLGNLMRRPLADMVRSEEQRGFGDNKAAGLPGQCMRCDVLPICRGECPKNRFAFAADGEPGLNYLCPGYRAFFRYAAPFMARIADSVRKSQNHAEAALLEKGKTGC